jgi:hypothetical protein
VAQDVAAHRHGADGLQPLTHEHPPGVITQ